MKKLTLKQQIIFVIVVVILTVVVHQVIIEPIMNAPRRHDYNHIRP